MPGASSSFYHSMSCTMNKDNQVLTQRREKAEALAALGVNLYSNSFKPANSVQELLPKGESLAPETAEPGSPGYSIAGRVMSMRKFGKAAFCHLVDTSGQIQIYLQRDTLGEE